MSALAWLSFNEKMAPLFANLDNLLSTSVWISSLMPELWHSASFSLVMINLDAKWFGCCNSQKNDTNNLLWGSFRFSQGSLILIVGA